MNAQLYRHFDAEDKLLYVGISLSSLHRLGQHKDHSHWFNQISRVTIENFSDRKLAMDAEREAIRKEKPIHNRIRYDNVITPPCNAINNSELNMVSKIVNFKPTYSAYEVAGVLGITELAVKKLISKKEIGSYELVGKTGKIRFRVTGWHLLEYVEHLKNGGKCDPT